MSKPQDKDTPVDPGSAGLGESLPQSLETVGPEALPGGLAPPDDPHLTAAGSSGPSEPRPTHRDDAGPLAAARPESTWKVPPAPRSETVAYDSAKGPALSAIENPNAGSAVP